MLIPWGSVLSTSTCNLFPQEKKKKNTGNGHELAGAVVRMACLVSAHGLHTLCTPADRWLAGACLWAVHLVMLRDSEGTKEHNRKTMEKTDK